MPMAHRRRFAAMRRLPDTDASRERMFARMRSFGAWSAEGSEALTDQTRRLTLENTLSNDTYPVS